MLPVVYPDGRMTFAQIMAFSFALIGFSILPPYRIIRKILFLGAIAIGMIPLYTAGSFAVSKVMQMPAKSF